MSFAQRTIPLRTIFKQRSAVSPKSSPIRRSWQRNAHRGYASGGGHSAAPKQSDLPWLIGAVTTTALGGWVIGLPAEDKHAHEHHGEGEEHAEHEESEDEEKSEGETEEQPESDEKSEDTDKGVIEEKPVGGNDRPDEKSEDDGPENPNFNRGAGPEAAKDAEVTGKGGNAGDGDNVGDTEGIKGKGATTEGAPSDTRKVYDDTKGYKKKRIESDNAHVLGPGGDGEAVNAKPPGSSNETTGKQEGLTNTTTKHSTPIHENPEKSKKPEGTAETSKNKGTVDPARPAS